MKCSTPTCDNKAAYGTGNWAMCDVCHTKANAKIDREMLSDDLYGPSQLDRIEAKQVQLQDGLLILIQNDRDIQDKLDRLLSESSAEERVRVHAEHMDGIVDNSTGLQMPPQGQ